MYWSQYTLVHFNTFWYISIHIGTFQYIWVYFNTFWYNSIHFGTFQYISIHFNVLSGSYFHTLSDNWQMISVVFWWFDVAVAVVAYLKNDDWLTFTLTFNLQEQYRSPNVSDTISCFSSLYWALYCVCFRERAHVLDARPSPRQNRRKVEARAIQIGRRTWDYLVIN